MSARVQAAPGLVEDVVVFSHHVHALAAARTLVRPLTVARLLPTTVTCYALRCAVLRARMR